MFMNDGRSRSTGSGLAQRGGPVSGKRVALLASLMISWANASTPLATPITDSAAQDPLMCSAPKAGATCSGAGPATQDEGAGGGIDVGAGNPVNLTNGNKYQREVDMAALPGVLGLEIVRHYNSASSRHKGLLGSGWRLSYETTLQRTRTGMQITQADGSRLHFETDPAHRGRYTGTDPSAGRLETGADGVSISWHWTHGSGPGRQLDFDRAGRLSRILAPSGEFVSLLYDGRGLLRKVIDPQGRTLELHYPDRARVHAQQRYAGVSRIVSPLGTHHYAYGSTDTPSADRQLLTSVTHAPTAGTLVIRRYHHEDPRLLLTGISQEIRTADGRILSQRLSTYAYDAAGRAIETAFMVAPPGGHDQRQESLRIDYRSAPRAGKPGLTVVTDAEGRVTRYRTARIGQALRVLEVRGAGCLRCGPVNVRHRYDASGRVLETVTLDADSGAPLQGRRFVHDPLGRLLRIEALRYQAGQPSGTTWLQSREYAGDAPHPALIEVPSVVEGRSHRFDLRYNDVGQVTEVHERGFSPLDAQGRPAARGSPIERLTRYRYSRINGRSLLTEIDGPLPNGPTNSPADSDITRHQYDPEGHHVQVIHHPAQLVERFDRDQAGRIVAHTPIDGVRIQYQLDHQGQPVRWQRAEAVIHVGRDALGHVTHIVQPDGEMLTPGSRTWAAAERMAEAPSATSASPLQPSAAQNATHWAGLQRWFDDFGRLCAYRTEATGTELRFHDEADRLIERRFADGVVWRWQRDAAGRILTHTVQMDDRAHPTLTKLEWNGARLVRIVHPDEIEERHHDASGRITVRRIERPQKLPQRPHALHYEERYDYDAADRLIRHHLPERGALRYRWGQGAQLLGLDWVDALHRLNPVIGLLPTRKQPAAASSSGYRHGNGIETRMQFDAHGRLQQLEHRLPIDQPSVWSAWITAARAASVTTPIAVSDDSLIEGWRYDYDPQQRITRRHDLRQSGTRRYGYDGQSRLIFVHDRSDGTGEKTEYYAYDAGDRMLGRRLDGRDEDLRPQAPTRNEAGLPTTQFAPVPGQRLQLEYSADRRLSAAYSPVEASSGEDLRPPVRHEYNAFGMRTRKTVFDAGTAAARGTQYLWQDHRLAAEVTEPAAAGATPTLSRRYIHAHGVVVATLDYPSGRALGPRPAPWLETVLALWDRVRGKAPQLHHVHGNEIGAPVAVTDTRRRVVWRADYAAYGAARIVSTDTGSGPYTLNLRLPGQYFDAETGWHDNVMRSYDPRRGEYLEPDPLGPAPLTRPYTYAAHNPLMLADPLGLVLFAFDGTGNTELSRTNVWLFAKQYGDLDAFDVLKEYKGTQFYAPGVGTSGGLLDNKVTGGGLAVKLRQSIDQQLKRLDDYVRDRTDYYVTKGELPASEPLQFDIDIVGFSRGAAAARDFSNRIAAREAAGYYQNLVRPTCIAVHLRFLGLFDTVLSAHVQDIDLAIPEAMTQVAHAVARNEHRPQFELESIVRPPAPTGSGLIARFWTDMEPHFKSSVLLGLKSVLAGLPLPPQLGNIILTQNVIETALDCLFGNCPSDAAGLVRNAAPNRIERSFVGAHADIGGGYNCASAECDAARGDLSDITLQWMVQQAQAAGVKMKALPDELRTVSQPVLHAETNTAPYSLYPADSDRQVDFATPFKPASKTAPLPALSYGHSLDFIRFDRQPDSPAQYQGQVDLSAYADWLQQHYALNVQP